MINTDVIEKVNAQFRLLISQIEDKEAEIKRLREALAIAAIWTAEPGVTIAEIRAALQYKENDQ